MELTPADRPSMLSRRLKALVIPATHNTVTTASSPGDPGEVGGVTHRPDREAGRRLECQP